MTRDRRRFPGHFPLSVLALTLGLGACGGSQAFHPTFEPAARSELGEVLSLLDTANPREPEPPVLVAVTSEPPRLLAWDLREWRQLWSQPADVRTSPIVAGHLVIAREGDRIVGRDVRTGRVVVELGQGNERLVGADGEAGIVAISLARGAEASPRGRVVGIRGSEVAWSEELGLPVGVPAVRGRLVLVPWAIQRLSVLDAATGVERARLHLEDSVIGHAFVHRDGTYVAQHGVFRVDPALETGIKKGASYYEPLGRPLPAQPPLLRDGYEPTPAPDSVWHRVRLLWKPVRDGAAIRLEDDTLYFLFYRLVFAFDPDEDELRWVVQHPSDFVGATVRPGGLLLADAEGRLVFLSQETGAVSWQAEVGEGLVAARFRAGTLTPPRTDPQAPVDALPSRLFAVASMSDRRLGGGRALAVRYLARFEDAEVTSWLVGLCSGRADDSLVREPACEAVAERTEGAPHIRRALLARASFIERTPAPPVGALARAAARMGLRAAVPVLVRHLEDPATPTDELPGLLAGLAELGDRRAAEPIAGFLRLYHATGGDPSMPDAIAAGAQALRTLDPVRAESIVRELATDPLAPPPNREALARVLEESAEGESEATASTEVDEEAGPGSTTRQERVDEGLPERITTDMRIEAFAPINRRLEGCLGKNGEGPSSARIAIVVEGDGSIGTVVVAPSELQECIESVVRSRTFPRTQRGRESIVHVVRR